MTAKQLVAALDAAGALPTAWREAFLAVPRHAFLPAKFWVDDGESAPQPINRDTDPDRWLGAAYTDVTIVTQFDDGAPAWPATGTAGAPVGASQVTTVEIDPLIAAAAKRALGDAGFPVTTITDDGAGGCSLSPGDRHRRRISRSGAV